MENPIQALEDVPQHLKDWVAGAIAAGIDAARAEWQKDTKHAQLEVKLEILELLDFANNKAADEIKSEIETLNADLKNL